MAALLTQSEPTIRTWILPPSTFDEEKALRWLGYGAQPTDTTRALLKKQGLLDRLAAVKAAPRQDSTP